MSKDLVDAAQHLQKLQNIATGIKAATSAAATYAGYKGGKKLVKKAKMLKPKKLIEKAKKVAKGVKTAAGVAKGGAAAIGTVANPVNRAKFYANAARGKGFVFPGSKYIGPGNEMNKGAPTSQADANAFQHDVDYDEYIKKGVSKKNVYLGYSDADERLLKKTKANTAAGFAVNVGMMGKKLLNKTGLTKRIRDKDVYGSAGAPSQGVRPGEYGVKIPSRQGPGLPANPAQSSVQTTPAY